VSRDARSGRLCSLADAAVDSEVIDVAVVVVVFCAVAVVVADKFIVRMQKCYRCMLLVRQGSKLMVGCFALLTPSLRSGGSSK